MGYMTLAEEKTGEFNTAHLEYVDKRILAQRTGDARELNRAYEDCKNKALALRDVLREQDPENSARADATITELEMCHEGLLRYSRGI